MTEEQKKRKAERDKKYRENKKLKAERAAIHPATLDAIRPVPVLDYPQTDFDVLMRRMRRESAK